MWSHFISGFAKGFLLVGCFLLFAWPLWCKGSIRDCGSLGRGSIPRSGPQLMGKVKIGVGGLLFWAEVAKPGQRRSPEAAVPKGFVGSNPTLRTILFRWWLGIRVFAGWLLW